MGIDMTDLEIVKKCAEKMGYSGWQSKHGYWNLKDPEGQDHVCCSGWNKFDPYSGEKIPEPTFNDALYSLGYEPLHDDAQAMALVKRFRLDIDSGFDSANEIEGWTVYGTSGMASSADLNRAICECVARLPD